MDQAATQASAAPAPSGQGGQKADAPSKTPKAKAGGVKDTIESILVAFILAFIFRAFVVEAFVIPTGSMAPTLLGAHMRFTCADCGYDFTVNYSTAADGDDINIPRFAEILVPKKDSFDRQILGPDHKPIMELKQKVYAVYCPNCGFKIGDEELANAKHEPGD